MSGWNQHDIPDQSGRIAIVTGANTGLGLETARELARKGAHVVLAVRTTGKGETAADDIRRTVPGAEVDVRELDLASLSSIADAADGLREEFDRIDLLIANAGVMYTPRRETADGFELQFGTNHLGHFAFVGRMLDRMLEVPGSRVVTVSSLAHDIRSAIRFDDLQSTKRYDRVAAYGRSKLANLLFTYALQRRLAEAGAETIALAAHPGVSATDLGRHLPGAELFRPLMTVMLQGSEAGALPSLRAATDPDAAGGQYYGPDGFREFRGAPVVVRSNRRSHDQAAQERLWTASEELTGVTFPV